MNCYAEKFISPYLCGYRKGFRTQQVSASIIEKSKISLDKKGYGGALLVNLSKVFDTLNNELLLRKLHVYGFNRYAHKTIHYYLNNRYQRAKTKFLVTGGKSFWEYHKGSVLGPINFNIYLNNLIYLAEKKV